MYKSSKVACFLQSITILLLFLSDNILFAEDYGFEALMDSTMFYHKQQDYQTALEWLLRAEVKAKEKFGEMDMNYVMLLKGIYSYYYYLGKSEKAIEYCEKAKPIIKKLMGEESTEYAEIVGNLGFLYKATGNYAAAEPLYKEALEMRRRLFKGDHPDLATSINNMAMFYNARGNYARAEPLYKEALEMRRGLYKGDHPDLARSINNMAAFYDDSGNYAAAEPLYKEALEMSRRLFKGDHPHLATSINNMAYFYNARGNYARAEALLKEALEMSRRLFKGDHPDLAQSINNMAGFYHDKGDYAEAEPFFIEALKVYLNVLTNYFPSLSESEKEKFWNTMKHSFEAFNSFALNRSKDNPSITVHLYNNLLFTKAMLLSSTMRVKNTILNSGDKELIRKYEDWLWQRNNLVKYYSMSKDELKKKNINLDSLEKSANEREKELSKLSNDFAKLTQKKEYKWQDVQKSLKQGEAAIEIIRYRYQDGKRWTDAVHYSALIIKPDSKYPELVTIENGNDLEGKYIELYRNQINKQRKASYDPDKIESDLKELYKQYWQPIAEKLDGIKTIYLSLDGVYNQFNLNTLVNPKTNQYILDELKIVQLTSTRDLIGKEKTLAAQPKSKKTAALFGDPKYDLDTQEYIQIASSYNLTREYYNIKSTLSEAERETIMPLPGTRVEIEKISGELGKKKWEVKKYLGIEALEEAIKTVKSPKVLHIATHGKFLRDVEINREERVLGGMEKQRISENPLLKSFLFFAGSENTLFNKETNRNTDDGLLTAYEAQNLYLEGTDLVVLSACETGLGEVKNGEGVYGLQRAFIQAGAKSLIMSLWTVNDRTTQELMVDFYRQWLSGKSKREAFTTAQQNLKSKYPGYYFWGAFVLIGE